MCRADAGRIQLFGPLRQRLLPRILKIVLQIRDRAGHLLRRYPRIIFVCLPQPFAVQPQTFFRLRLARI